MTLSSQTKNTEQTHFTRCLRSLERDVLRMGALVEESCRLSYQCLFDRHLEAAKILVSLDRRIDKYYRQIEADCATIMTLKAPVAQDLRLLSAFMQLVRDLERIADYAQDLAEIAVKLFAYPEHPCMSDVEAMFEHARTMLSTSLAALVDLESTAGQRVKQLDDTVDEAYEKIYQKLAYQRDIKGVVEPIVLLALAIRCIERMADHATNIAQRVSYIVTGNRS